MWLRAPALAGAAGAAAARAVHLVLVVDPHVLVVDAVVVADDDLAANAAGVGPDRLEQLVLDAGVGVPVHLVGVVGGVLAGQHHEGVVAVTRQPVGKHLGLVGVLGVAPTRVVRVLVARVDQEHEVDLLPAGGLGCEVHDRAVAAGTPACQRRDALVLGELVGRGHRLAGVAAVRLPHLLVQREAGRRRVGLPALEPVERAVVDEDVVAVVGGEVQRTAAGQCRGRGAGVAVGLAVDPLVRLDRRVQVAVRDPAGLAGRVVVADVDLVPQPVVVRADGLALAEADELDLGAVEHVAVLDAVGAGHVGRVAQIQPRVGVVVGVDDVEDQASASESSRRSDRAQAGDSQGECERRH